MSVSFDVSASTKVICRAFFIDDDGFATSEKIHRKMKFLTRLSGILLHLSFLFASHGHDGANRLSSARRRLKGQIVYTNDLHSPDRNLQNGAGAGKADRNRNRPQ
jgi:hypothetical protein